MNPFQQYVLQFLQQKQGERICSFEYQEKKYWLKQPEQLSLIWRLLKSNPQKSFQNEITALQELNKAQAPVPIMPLWGEDFFVLEDAGEAVSHYLNPQYTDEQKLSILLDCGKGLLSFHQQGFIHGRPAVRDMIWRDGKICFVDFENYKSQQQTPTLIARDIIIFLYSLCREEGISDALLLCFLSQYQRLISDNHWVTLIKRIKQCRWLQRLLLPFKSIAKKDLRAIYRLFDAFDKLSTQ